MSGLRNLKSVLPIFLICLMVPCNMVAAEERLNKAIRLESHLLGHLDSMWNPALRNKWKESGFSISNSTSTQGTPPLLDSITMAKKSERRVDANLLEMSLHDVISGCESGDLNLLPLHQVLPDGVTLADYVWNGVQPCAIGHSVWATYPVFDTTRYIDRSAPVLMQDFFNTTAYPGKRAMKKSPQAIVEWALLTSGIPRRDIYRALSSDKIWPLIEKKLQQLASEIIWVDTDQEALELLDSGSDRFAMVSSYNLVRKIAENNKLRRSSDHYGVIWNRAVAHMSFLAIPKNSEADGVLDFLRFIIDPICNLQMSTALGYAPVSRGHASLINERYRRALPVDSNTDDLLWGNDKWWREQGGEIEELFQSFAERTFQLETAQKGKNIFDG